MKTRSARAGPAHAADRDPWVARGFGLLDLVVLALVVHLYRPSRTSRPVSAALAAGSTIRDVDPPPPGYVDADRVPAVAAALGDFLPSPPLMKVLSVGDLLLLLGVVALLALLTATRPAVAEPGRPPVPTR